MAHYGRPSPTGPRALQAREREQRALRMRIEGRRVAEIAGELGMAAGSVSNMLRRALRDTTALTEEYANEVRALEGEKLDAAANALWPQVIGGDARAHDTWLRNRARYASLFGLDRAVPPAQVTNAPIQINLGSFGLPAEEHDGEIVDQPALEAGEDDAL
jgi:DNA-binding CsgD family transcriptional regulator